MITRPLDLASRLRPPPRGLDWIFFVNVGLLALFFSVFGSRFVLAPGLGLNFRLPGAAGPAVSARPASHVISVLDSGQVFTPDGLTSVPALGPWLKAQAGRVDEAIAAYQAIQAKNARLTTVGLLLGGLYRDKAQRETDPAARQALLTKAIASYDELARGDIPNTRARIELARTHVLAGNAEAAARLFQDVMSGEPNSAAAAEAAAQLQAIRR